MNNCKRRTDEGIGIWLLGGQSFFQSGQDLKLEYILLLMMMAAKLMEWIKCFDLGFSVDAIFIFLLSSRVPLASVKLSMMPKRKQFHDYAFLSSNVFDVLCVMYSALGAMQVNYIAAYKSFYFSSGAHLPIHISLRLWPNSASYLPFLSNLPKQQNQGKQFWTTNSFLIILDLAALKQKPKNTFIMAFLTKEKWWVRMCCSLLLKDLLVQNFHWRYLNQTLLKSKRDMDVESSLKLFSNVPDYPLFSHFISLSTPVKRRRESSLIITFEKITFKFLAEQMEILEWK